MNAQFESMTLREQVEAEALANGYRRETARQDGAANRGLRGPTAARFQVGDRVRQIAAELAAEEEAERRAKMKAPTGRSANVAVITRPNEVAGVWNSLAMSTVIRVSIRKSNASSVQPR